MQDGDRRRATGENGGNSVPTFMLQLPRPVDCWNHMCRLGPQGRSSGSAAMLTSLLMDGSATVTTFSGKPGTFLSGKFV